MCLKKKRQFITLFISLWVLGASNLDDISKVNATKFAQSLRTTILKKSKPKSDKVLQQTK